jgi:uncharacterized membrane protein
MVIMTHVGNDAILVPILGTFDITRAVKDVGIASIYYIVYNKMDKAASTFCRERQISYGIIAVAIGIFANFLGTKIMKTYDDTRDESYKWISIAILSIGVILIAYGVASLALRNNLAFCSLTML